MSIRGPKFKIPTHVTDGDGPDLSEYVRKTGARMTGRLNMGGKKITNLGTATDPNDAVTKGEVSNLTSYLNNRKVNKSGDSMTGPLDMGGEKITNLGTPSDNKDATNKEYVDSLVQHEHDVALHAVGRYIVIPNEEDGTKTYFSVRAKKNVDLDSGKLVEVKNGETLNINPQQIRVSSESDELDNPGKDLNIMQYNTSNLEVYFIPPNTIPQPWNLSFSAIIPNTTSTLTFQVNPRTQRQVAFLWNVDGLTFTIYNIRGEVEYTASVPELSQQDMIHISMEYVNTKFCVWINGVQKIAYTTVLGSLTEFELSVPKLGILSVYNRNLNKQEIVQHFIDYHVENFTDDEVLI